MDKSVLIVEDESIIALDIQKTLISLGYSVCGICATGQKAIEKCRELLPKIVLMDIRLKGDLDGIDTAIQIQQELSIPIIYLTSHADPVTLERAKITEPYGYILKPFNSIELNVALELTFFKKYHLISKENESNKDSKIIENELDNLDSIINKLSENKYFSNVSKKSLEKMLVGAQLKTLKAGEPIVFEGEDRAYGFLVISGRLALFKSSFSGKELVVELINPFDLFGLAVAIENQPYSFSAKTQIDSKILLISRKGILGLLDDENLYRQFINLIAERLSCSHDTSRSLAHDKVDVRVANALLRLIPNESNNNQIIPIHITRRELADLTGTTVETSIRITKNMEQAGLLDLTQNSFIKVLKVPELKQIAANI